MSSRIGSFSGHFANIGKIWNGTLPRLGFGAPIPVTRLAGQRIGWRNDSVMSKNILCWTDIPVTDLPRAVGFYKKVLDEDVTVQKFDDFEFALLPHADDSVSGCLTPSDENKPSRNGPLVYLSVSGRLDEAVKAAAENGGEVLKPKHPIGPHGFRAVIIDSEGNRIALHSETA
jgi:predicted enzyme related to lactoylglutathione lyase